MAPVRSLPLTRLANLVLTEEIGGRRPTEREIYLILRSVGVRRIDLGRAHDVHLCRFLLPAGQILGRGRDERAAWLCALETLLNRASLDHEKKVRCKR